MAVSGQDGLKGAFLATGYPWRALPTLELYLGIFRDVFRALQGGPPLRLGRARPRLHRRRGLRRLLRVPPVALGHRRRHPAGARGRGGRHRRRRRRALLRRRQRRGRRSGRPPRAARHRAAPRQRGGDRAAQSAGDAAAEVRRDAPPRRRPWIVEVQVHPADRRRRVRYLFLSRRQVTALSMLALVYLAGDRARRRRGAGSGRRPDQPAGVPRPDRRAAAPGGAAAGAGRPPGRARRARPRPRPPDGPGRPRLRPAAVHAAERPIRGRRSRHRGRSTPRRSRRGAGRGRASSSGSTGSTARSTRCGPSRRRTRSGADHPVGLPARRRTTSCSSAPSASAAARSPSELEIHPGVDLAAPVGTPIHATADGVVAFAGQVPISRSTGWWRYGNLVIVEDGDGFFTLYGHDDRVDVRRGSR